MKRLVAIALALFVVSSLPARPPEKYAPDAAGFEVTFPGKPKETKATPTTQLGKLRVVTATFADGDNNVFMASHTDFPVGAAKPENRDALLDGVRNGLKGKDGTVLSNKDIVVGPGKHEGQELAIEKGKQHIRARIVLRGDRLFQVAVVGTKDFVATAEAEAFLKSFELTP